MKTLSEHLIDTLWPKLVKEGTTYRTPDEQKGTEYSIQKTENSTIIIQTAGNSLITIQQESFIAAIRYLLLHGHVRPENACPIGACIDKPSPLDQETRGPSGGTMVIPYILPMLAATGVVRVCGGRPNRVWLIP